MDSQRVDLDADKGLGWGKSLRVPSVQEIVRNDSECVPERYIQENKDRPTDSIFPDAFDEIPIIDYSLLANGDEEELNKLDFACKEWGFFQIINHGVAVEILQHMMAAAEAFFDLPLEEKKKYAVAENDVQGYGQAYVVSEHQKLDWGDLTFLMTQPSEYRNFSYGQQIYQVSILPSNREAVEEYSEEIQRVSEEVLGSISLLIGMDKQGLKRSHGVMKQGMRMNYYPRCSRPELVLGFSPHSDGGSISFLLQDDEITGLQIKYKERWLPVKPIPNALAVNVGDVIEAWSNGVYKSIEHRAVTNTKKARISVGTFVLPHEDVQIGPVESMMIDRPRMYRDIKFIDYTSHVFKKKMDGKAQTDFLKLDT